MDTENVVIKEARDLLTKILQLTNPLDNTSMIHLEHNQFTDSDTSSCIRYSHKATIDLLISEGVINVRNHPLESERTADTWKYKVIIYRNKAKRLLKKLGLRVSTPSPKLKTDQPFLHRVNLNTKRQITLSRTQAVDFTGWQDCSARDTENGLINHYSTKQTGMQVNLATKNQ